MPLVCTQGPPFCPNKPPLTETGVGRLIPVIFIGVLVCTLDRGTLTTSTKLNASGVMSRSSVRLVKVVR